MERSKRKFIPWLHLSAIERITLPTSCFNWAAIQHIKCTQTNEFFSQDSDLFIVKLSYTLFDRRIYDSKNVYSERVTILLQPLTTCMIYLLVKDVLFNTIQGSSFATWMTLFHQSKTTNSSGKNKPEISGQKLIVISFGLFF